MSPDYAKGVQDGAVVALFASSDDEPHMLFGRKFTVEVKWLDDPPPEKVVAFRLAAARERAGLLS